MSDAALTLLKFALLAFLYLFFAWVVWTGIRQLRTQPASSGPKQAAAGRTAAPARAKTGGRGQLLIQEPAELSGAVLAIGDELTIGRAAACVLTLDDTFVSQHHASIVWRDRQYFVEDAGSTNGTFVNRERLVTPVVLRPGDMVQIGSTVLEFS